jgi:hypothetical protein
LWLNKHWFSASTFVVKIATFAKRQTVIAQCKKPTAQMAHLVFPDTRPSAQKTKRAIFCQRTDRQTKE